MQGHARAWGNRVHPVRTSEAKYVALAIPMASQQMAVRWPFQATSSYPYSLGMELIRPDVNCGQRRLWAGGECLDQGPQGFRPSGGTQQGTRGVSLDWRCELRPAASVRLFCATFATRADA